MEAAHRGSFDQARSARMLRPMPPATHPTASPFMLIFRNAGEESHRHLSPSQRQTLMQQWNEWYETLAAAGKVEQGRPLGLDGRVLSGPRGERVTDGPYAEAKEAVGGYVVVLARDLDEATEMARGCPGLPIGVTVEIRPVLASSPVLEGVRGHGPGG